jgi:type III restriction enzyme
MPNPDRQRFNNKDLVLKVNQTVNLTRWDESHYEGFFDELCRDREYQKEAIRTALRYLLGGEYKNLTALARQNYDQNPILEQRYGSWESLQRHLQFPNQLSASLDLATGTGKSYVLYGIAAVLLAEGVVDRVLVLCPSTTIENGLTEKFRELSTNANLRALLPDTAKWGSIHITNARSSIPDGSICVENYHAVLEHVSSSIYDNLWGKGHRTAVLNDEAHHVANEPTSKSKKWKEFLQDIGYGFYYMIGVSGTCYIDDEYFADVIYRYSLRQAMEEGYVKRVDYIAEMSQTEGDPVEEKWQLIRSRHEETKGRLKEQGVLPLTIIVTHKISVCSDVADELRHFLIETEGISPEVADQRVLVVYNNAPDVKKLPYLDDPQSKVEWIVSVSMLNEGWDVKRVFQIVPHEQRAFNSKLLIAQVLGRGLRVPDNWKGIQPEVTVFNHDAWAGSIRHLVKEILEIEKRLTSYVVSDSPYHFDLHNIDYTVLPSSVTTPMTKEYTIFSKGYIDIAGDPASEVVNIEYEQALTGDRYTWQAKIKHKTYTPGEIAAEMYSRLEEAQDPDDPDPKMRTIYTDKFPISKLEKIVKKSLEQRKMTVATDSIKQKFLQALGTLRRKASQTVRYTPIPNRFYTLSTKQRQADSVGSGELRSTKTYFFTELTRETLKEDQVEFFDEVSDEGGGFKAVHVRDPNGFKTPLNAVIADHDPERRFIRELLAPANLPYYDAWIKSTNVKFYDIDYAWRKGEHPKRGKFNPDFFIKAGNLVLVVEIKGTEELIDPSEENRKKNEYAIAHFERVNKHLEEQNNSLRYKFNFLTPNNYSKYFQYLREGQILSYNSELDIRLTE